MTRIRGVFAEPVEDRFIPIEDPLVEIREAAPLQEVSIILPPLQEGMKFILKGELKGELKTVWYRIGCMTHLEPLSPEQIRRTMDIIKYFVKIDEQGRDVIAEVIFRVLLVFFPEEIQSVEIGGLGEDNTSVFLWKQGQEKPIWAMNQRLLKEGKNGND